MALSIREIFVQMYALQIDKEEFYCKVGTVTAKDADDNTFTVDPLDNSAPIEKVRVKPIITGETDGTVGAIFMLPAIGSKVLMGFASPTEAYILNAEVVDSITFNATDIKMDGSNLDIDIDTLVTIDAPTITINGGALGGLINIATLTEKLNDLRDDFNALVSSYNTHTHTGVTTGMGTSGFKAQSDVDDADEFIQGDYEDTNVTH